MAINRLKESRESNDLMQKEVANVLGITQRNYSYFETGHTALTDDILIKIANFYETSIDYLLYQTDVKKRYDKSVIKEKIIA